MNILLINHYAGSPKLGMEYRPYYLAREWTILGHKVTVIAGDTSHIRTHNPVIKKSFQSQTFDNIEYLWIKTPKYNSNGFRRVINMFSFTFKLYLKSKKLARQYHPDIIIASSTYPMDNIPAKRIARFNKAKYVYEVHDLWPLSPIELGSMSKLHPFIILMQWAENFAYKNADKVVSMLPKTLEYMTKHGLKPEKWHYIPNGIAVSEWDNPMELDKSIEDKITTLKNKGHLLIAYTGTLGLANNLTSFIQAANILKDENKFHFIIVGKGPEKDKLQLMVSQLKLNNLTFLPPLAKESMPELLKHFDILYIGLKKQSLFRFGISPNKLIDYMMAAKPVIMAIEAGNDMVKEANCGISVEAENPEAIAKAIKQLDSRSAQELLELGNNGKCFVLKNHDYKLLASKFLEIFS